MKAACGAEIKVGSVVFAYASPMRSCMPDEVRLGRVVEIRAETVPVAVVNVHGVGRVDLGAERITMTVGGSKGPKPAAVERFRAWERGVVRDDA